jgi:hypothetical protein
VVIAVHWPMTSEKLQAAGLRWTWNLRHPKMGLLAQQVAENIVRSLKGDTDQKID